LVGPGIVEAVASVLASHRFAPSALCLEITESVLMDDTFAVTTALTSIHDLGVRLAVDDFGTGYSSLLYLRRFPVDALKLDQSFVSGVDANPLDSIIVRSVIDLAHSLGLTSVAEGVETSGQLTALRSMGCDLGQGYFWSPGIPAAEVDRLLLGDGVLPVAEELVSERTTPLATGPA
jgi:EAL domain-containing protein (putative c-di-GMP-specific phosphodiesterase class I)